MEVNGARQQIRELKREHPEWGLKKIGDAVNRTPQRVSQILKTEGLRTRGVRIRRVTYCKVCRAETQGGKIVCEGACREEYFYTTVYCKICDEPKRILKSAKIRLEKSQRFFYCGRADYYEGKRKGLS